MRSDARKGIAEVREYVKQQKQQDGVHVENQVDDDDRAETVDGVGLTLSRDPASAPGGCRKRCRQCGQQGVLLLVTTPRRVGAIGAPRVVFLIHTPPK